jgi:hypothetical protein
LLLFSFIPSFDDGFGGGSVLTKNVIANACRESSDHGKELGGKLRERSCDNEQAS